ncbi:MAG: hypothetical protein AB8C95_13900, partial [Phycisphaeraceae bacterium]
MSTHSPAPASPPRLILTVLIAAVSIVGSFVFARAFDDIQDIPNFLDDPTLCGNPTPLVAKQPDAHESHGVKKNAKPLIYVGGLWSEKHGLAGQLDAAILSASAGKPTVVQSAIWTGSDVVVIDRSPI